MSRGDAPGTAGSADLSRVVDEDEEEDDVAVAADADYDRRPCGFALLGRLVAALFGRAAPEPALWMSTNSPAAAPPAACCSLCCSRCFHSRSTDTASPFSHSFCLTFLAISITSAVFWSQCDVTPAITAFVAVSRLRVYVVCSM